MVQRVMLDHKEVLEVLEFVVTVMVIFHNQLIFPILLMLDCKLATCMYLSCLANGCQS